MFNFMAGLEHLMPGIGQFTRMAMDMICAKDDCQRWLRAMARMNVRGVHTYSVTDQPYCTMEDLLELDDLLADRRALEFEHLGYCQDMHPHYEAAFKYVNAGRACGINYTLADYGRLIKWNRNEPISQHLSLVLSQTFREK